MLGRLPISYSEIHAWARLTGRQVDPFDVRALRLLDAVLLRVAREANEADASGADVSSDDED